MAGVGGGCGRVGGLLACFLPSSWRDAHYVGACVVFFYFGCSIPPDVVFLVFFCLFFVLFVFSACLRPGMKWVGQDVSRGTRRTAIVPTKSSRGGSGSKPPPFRWYHWHSSFLELRDCFTAVQYVVVVVVIFRKRVCLLLGRRRFVWGVYVWLLGGDVVEARGIDCTAITRYYIIGRRGLLTACMARKDVLRELWYASCRAINNDRAGGGGTLAAWRN